MAEVHFSLGADIDVASGAELGAAVAGLKGHMDGKFKPGCKPIYRPLAQAGSFPVVAGATNSAVQLDLGSPAAGRIWRVTRVCVVGADDHTVPTGVVGAIYVGDPFSPMLTNVVTEGRALPFTQANNDEFLWVHSRENLFVNFSSTAAVASAVGIACTATVLEYVEGAEDATRI